MHARVSTVGFAISAFAQVCCVLLGGGIGCGGSGDDGANAVEETGPGRTGPTPTKPAADAGPNDPEAAPLPTGPTAGGWLRAFAAGGVGMKCSMTEAQLEAARAPVVSVGAAKIFVGFEQIGQNQDPIFVRFDAGAQTYCVHHEREAPDGRALGLAWDGGPIAYVVYSIVGGGSAFDQKGKGQWLDRYGDGGASSAVSFLGEVDATNGSLRKGTFVIAKKQDGKTNTHRPAAAPAVLADGKIEFHGESAFQPMNPDKSIMSCTGYPFHTKYVFAPDLKTLACSSSTNCTAKVPCP
jgi:hypothetical protein